MSDSTIDVQAEAEAALADAAARSHQDPAPEPTTPDWTPLADDRVLEALTAASSKVGRMFAAITSADDMYQDGALLLANNADKVREYLADELVGKRSLYRWLRDRLIDSQRPIAQRAGLNVPLTSLPE